MSSNTKPNPANKPQSDACGATPDAGPSANTGGASANTGGSTDAGGTPDAETGTLTYTLFQEITHQLELISLNISHQTSDLAAHRQVTVAQHEFLATQGDVIRQLQAQLEALDITVRNKMRLLEMALRTGFEIIHNTLLALMGKWLNVARKL
ncbi:hypothetical protein PENSPDRAFT_662243 [Peniophora sp. CONT]|nr:hypothetical protein PENSPDRAFT_662243 [Peniophora sp. CONT]